jgi:5-methylcytosine-specific restriction protein A
MALGDITKQSVEMAIAEFDRLGRGQFLKKYGFRKARSFRLVHNGRHYDSKAIAGAAHAFLPNKPGPLEHGDFNGGDSEAAPALRKLGFTVINDAEVVSDADKQPAANEMPFEQGHIYNRRRDLHAPFGGQQQGGISTPADTPFLFLFTGPSGEQFGYSDGWRDDGIFAYTGQGQSGDMQFIRGNAAIRDHAKNGKDLLLFQETASGNDHRFLGCFSCAGWEERQGPDKDGHQRKVIVFQLVPTDSPDVQSDPELERELDSQSLDALRSLALAASNTPSHNPKTAVRTYLERSRAVKAYVLKRAAGVCEACKQPAPFQKRDGAPYLEPHHVRRVADGGPDDIRYVAGICPTCHRRVHHGIDGKAWNEELAAAILEIEQRISKPTA